MVFERGTAPCRLDQCRTDLDAIGQDRIRVLRKSYGIVCRAFARSSLHPRRYGAQEALLTNSNANVAFKFAGSFACAPQL